MRLDKIIEEIKVLGEPIEVLEAHQTTKGYLDIDLCVGKRIRVPISNVVLGEDEGRGTFCHIIGEEGVIEFPVVKNPGYVTFNQYI